MEQIDWDDSFSFGNEIIDRQHRKWIELYNTLVKAMSESTPAAFSGVSVDALQVMHEYTLYHFRYEENVMANAGYPGLAHHWRLHKDFDYKIFAYLRKMETGKLVSNSELLDMLRKWLINHIFQEDMKVHRFLKKRVEAENRLE